MLMALLVAASLRLTSLAEVPPGVHYDEAANGVLAAEIGLHGDRPIFISSYTGKEVLFFYLAGGLMRLLGASVLTLRLTAAFVGLLTVAATYWLGQELKQKRAVALLAAALLATSFWQLVFSHLGFRAITQPLLQALTVAALLRGIRLNDWRWLAAAGVFLGLTGYTYLAARLFPVLLLLALLPVILNRAMLRRRWGQMFLALLAALLVLAPLLVYFVNHPDAFWVRIGQVAPGSGQNLGLIESYLKSLGMFFLEGDPYVRLNLPQRPLFNWLWGGLLVVGWVVVLLRWRQLKTDWQHAAALLLLLAPFVMILPTALAVGEIIPSNLRAIGLAPFIFFLPAVGLQRLADDLDRRIQGLPAEWLVLAVGLTWLSVGGLQTEKAYFQEWATRTDLFYATDGDLTAVAPFLDSLDTTNKTIYVAAPHYQHPTLAFLSQKYGRIKWLPQSQALVFPAEGAAVYIFPHSSPLPDWAEPYMDTAVLLDSPLDSSGEPIFTAYERTTTADLSTPDSLNINFGGAITLLGYSLEPGYVNETIPLRLVWRVDGPPPGDFTPFVHLEDAWGYRWNQVETFAYPSTQWQAGEMIVQQVNVPVPPGTPPGAAYHLRVGQFNQATGERLPRLDADGRYAGDSFVIADTAVIASSPPQRLPQPPFVIDEPVREGLRLLGYGRGGYTAATSETIGVALWWLAGLPQAPLETRLELQPAAGPGRILTTTQPVHDTLPFDIWPTPIFLIDHVDGRIPDDVTPGTYRLDLRLFDRDGGMVYTANLGTLTIEKSQRLFEAPPVQNKLDVLFGNEISLLGYDLAVSGENQYDLTLVWQAAQVPADDYTVFVHLLDQNGVCCLWQADAMPQQNQYPTNRWLADEVVVDTYQIIVPDKTPPGEYGVEVGLYLAGNGRRLQASSPQSAASDAIVFLLKVSQ
ncbi:MAG: glycosyltransferase family 39 protein [Ardenticatenaceae bacterium]|nr:glycosyltransferase family 39 protein [Ardenticatenaceae bacterium]MCB9444571.1 glycosyltransferase family 39 protein [Ardenticatenaceae bacterium]